MQISFVDYSPLKNALSGKIQSENVRTQYSQNFTNSLLKYGSKISKVQQAEDDQNWSAYGAPQTETNIKRLSAQMQESIDSGASYKDQESKKWVMGQDVTDFKNELIADVEADTTLTKGNRKRAIESINYAFNTFDEQGLLFSENLEISKAAKNRADRTEEAIQLGINTGDNGDFSIVEKAIEGFGIKRGTAYWDALISDSKTKFDDGVREKKIYSIATQQSYGDAEKFIEAQNELSRNVKDSLLSKASKWASESEKGLETSVSNYAKDEFKKGTSSQDIYSSVLQQCKENKLGATNTEIAIATTQAEQRNYLTNKYQEAISNLDSMSGAELKEFAESLENNKSEFEGLTSEDGKTIGGDLDLYKTYKQKVDEAITTIPTIPKEQLQAIKDNKQALIDMVMSQESELTGQDMVEQLRSYILGMGLSEDYAQKEVDSMLLKLQEKLPPTLQDTYKNHISAFKESFKILNGEDEEATAELNKNLAYFDGLVMDIVLDNARITPDELETKLQKADSEFLGRSCDSAKDFKQKGATETLKNIQSRSDSALEQLQILNEIKPVYYDQNKEKIVWANENDKEYFKNIWKHYQNELIALGYNVKETDASAMLKSGNNVFPLPVYRINGSEYVVNTDEKLYRVYPDGSTAPFPVSDLSIKERRVNLKRLEEKEIETQKQEKREKQIEANFERRNNLRGVQH